MKNYINIAIYNGDLLELKKLVEEGADINNFRGTGLSPIMAAVWYLKSDCVEYLLEKGVDPKKRGNFYLETPELILKDAHFKAKKQRESLEKQEKAIQEIAKLLKIKI